MVASNLLIFFRNVKRDMVPYACPLGVVSNLVLIYLICYKSNSQMKSFRKALLLTCITEMSFSGFNTVFVFTLIVQEDIYYAIVDGILGPLSRNWSLAGFSTYLIFIYICVTHTTVVFYFRYSTVCRNKTLTVGPFMLLVLASWAIVLFYVIICTYIYATDPVTLETFETLKGSGYPSDGSFTYFTSCKLARFSNFSMFYAIPLTTAAYLAVIFWSFMIWREFRNLRSLLSIEQKRFHREVTLVLWVEAVTPFVTVVLPIYVDLSKVFFPAFPFDWLAELIWILIISEPTFTAFVKIISIKSFRNALFKSAKSIFTKQSTSNIVVSMGRNSQSKPAQTEPISTRLPTVMHK